MRRPCGAFTVAAMACWWEKYTTLESTRCVAIPGEDASKKTQAGAATAVAAARAKDGQATRGAREAAMRAVARAQDARLGRWLGRVGWGRGRLALIELLNGGALAASLAALAVEEEPQLKPAEHAVAHYGAGALFADPRF